jgi:hypothetical protein
MDKSRQTKRIHPPSQFGRRSSSLTHVNGTNLSLTNCVYRRCVRVIAPFMISLISHTIQNHARS